MVLVVVKVMLAIGVALGIYLLAANAIRAFTVAPPAEPNPDDLQPVSYKFRCVVCGTEATVTAAPFGELPDPPRHCREDMALVVEGGEW
jgi:hypothetical protein